MLEHQHARTGELTTGSTDSRQRLDTSVPTAKADFSMQVRSRSIMSSRKRLEQLLSFNLASRTPSGRPVPMPICLGGELPSPCYRRTLSSPLPSVRHCCADGGVWSRGRATGHGRTARSGATRDRRAPRGIRAADDYLRDCGARDVQRSATTRVLPCSTRACTVLAARLLLCAIMCRQDALMLITLPRREQQLAPLSCFRSDSPGPPSSRIERGCTGSSNAPFRRRARW